MRRAGDSGGREEQEEKRALMGHFVALKHH